MWVDEYRTGSGSDRVGSQGTSEHPAAYPVATAPGSVFVFPVDSRKRPP